MAKPRARVIQLPANGWRPRPRQYAAWAALEAGVRRLALAWHRRYGKDDLSLHWTACDAMQNVGKVAESAAQFAGPLKDFVEPLQRFSKDAPAMLDRFRDTMRENRSYATPIMSGALGAGLGNMAGHYLEDDGKRLSAAEQTRQKRNRILLTLLGGGIGTVAGMRGTQGLPPLSPSGAERTAMTAKFHELLGRLGVKKSSVVPEFKPDGATRRADDAIALQYKYSRPAPEKLPAVAPSVPTVNGVKMWMPSAAPRKPVGAAK